MKRNNKIHEVDPVKPQARADATQYALSPMDLPDAFSIPNVDDIPHEELHPMLQELVEEHKTFIGEIDAFEKALNRIQEEGICEDTSRDLARFYRFFDEQVLPHNRKEEWRLFARLHERLLERSTHTFSASHTTSVDVLEGDHARLLQTAAISFNLFGLAGHLPDAVSKAITLDAAIQQGMQLVEQLRLHIFREDHVVFPLAQRLLSAEEMDTPWVVH